LTSQKAHHNKHDAYEEDEERQTDARKFELPKTATPSESKIRKSPDPELHILPPAAFACVDKIPIFRGELLKECR